MSVIKWYPRRERDDVRKFFERSFSDFFEPLARRHSNWWPSNVEEGTYLPNIELYDKKDDIVVSAELPGIEKEDIDLSITHDTLTIKGEIKKDEEIKEENCYCSERSYGKFSRIVSLPHEVDSEKAEAHHKNGLLEIVLPKKEEAKLKEKKLKIA